MAKPVLAIDIDDVLAPHNEVLAAWHNTNYGTNHTVFDMHDDWKLLWGVDYDEAERRAAQFHASPDLLEMQPLDGALEALIKLKESYGLIVVTGRRPKLFEHTIRWLNEHFDAIFEDVRFVKVWGADRSITKAETCKDIGAVALIDDSPTQILACAKQGVKGLLFGDYRAFNDMKLPDNVSRVNNWDEVLKELL